jgi:hypothetical protein
MGFAWKIQEGSIEGKDFSGLDFVSVFASHVAGPKDTNLGWLTTGVPEFREQGLLFGHDAWGEGRELNEFINAYDGQKGTRYQLWSPHVQMVAALNVFDFGDGLKGIASVAVKPQERNKGWLRVLLPAMHTLLEQHGATRFALFSEVPKVIYEKFGYVSCPEALQKFLPSVAMIKGQLKEEDDWWEKYF